MRKKMKKKLSPHSLILTSTTLEVLSSNLKKPDAILVSFLTENCPFDSIFNFMLIKCC